MGAMTLVFLGEDHVEHWTSIIGEDAAEMGVFDLRQPLNAFPTDPFALRIESA